MDTNIGTKARAAIEKAEQAIRDLISQAATGQNYAGVSRLAEIAQSLSDLAQRSEFVSRTGPGSSDGSHRPVADVTREPLRKNSGKPRSRLQSKNPKGVARVYPKFHVAEDRLIKTGWSKKQKSEYEHRAPYEAVQRTMEALRREANGNSPISIDQIVPVTLVDGDEVPLYQIYMTVAWLRSIGLLKKKGRDRYELVGDGGELTFEAARLSTPAREPTQ